MIICSLPLRFSDFYFQNLLMIINFFYKRYNSILKSIAFLPAIIALCFLLLSWVMIELDFSETGKHIKSGISWLRLKDATTARSIISSIVSGIISLTVFSFSMVMIILNQAASQMSNRILDKLIGNRFQQLVLGFYIGTIVYALFLLSTIRDIDSGIYVPALSTYLLITLTIIDIFLFIYFLHFITQSVKYEKIIARINNETIKSMKKNFSDTIDVNPAIVETQGITVSTFHSGVYQGYLKQSLIKFAKSENILIEFLHPAGTYLLEKTPLLVLFNGTKISEKKLRYLQNMILIEEGQDVDTNYFYGFRQLTEVAIKALSPGINDPGTAIISLHALFGLLAYRLKIFPILSEKDDRGEIRIIINERTIDNLISNCLLPIWDYGKEDRLIQKAFSEMLTQLEPIKKISQLLLLRSKVNKVMLQNESE